MQWWRRARQAVKDVLVPRPPTLQEQVQHYRRLYAKWQQQQPSVDEQHRQDARAEAARHAAALEALARRLAWAGSVFPGDGDAAPLVRGFEGWASRTVTDEAEPAPLPMTERDDDLSSPNPARWLKWQTDEERLGPSEGRWRP